MSGAPIPVTVVVAFYSNGGTTETRALTAAVGAVNARALIRMRRMPDVDGGDSSPDGVGAELQRMRREYVPPTEADIVGAEGLVVAVPQGTGVGSAEFAPFVTMLGALAEQGKLRGKVAGVVAGGDSADAGAFTTFLLGLGFVVVPPTAVDVKPSAGKPLAAVQAHGRQVAEVARALKAARSR